MLVPINEIRHAAECIGKTAKLRIELGVNIVCPDTPPPEWRGQVTE